MEYVGDNYLENINVMVSWGFVALVTAIYIVSQNFLLGLIFVIFTIMRPIPQFIMNRRLQDSGDSWSKLRTKLHGLSRIVCKAAKPYGLISHEAE